MATFPFTIPDPYLQVTLDAYADHYNYDKNKLDGETKAQFAKRMMISKMKNIVKNYMVKNAITVPMGQAELEADSIDIT